jgi:hypothetical protein
MTPRAQKLMAEIWEDRNNWADTEEKLVSAILRRVSNHVKTMTAAKLNNLSVIDKNDLIALSNELNGND